MGKSGFVNIVKLSAMYLNSVTTPKTVETPTKFP